MATSMVEFPIPQELKDEIYSYLLSPEAAIDLTRARTHEKPDPRHDYETSILLVNKSIGLDAARYLRSQNSFVRIESDGFGLFSQLARLGAHIISTQIDDQCPHLAFSISVLTPEHYFVVEDRHLEVRHYEGVESVLILERDMDKFWTVLRMACHSEPIDCVLIYGTPGVDVELAISEYERNGATVDIFATQNSRKRKADFLQFARDNGSGFMEITCYSETGEKWAPPSRLPSDTLVWPLAFEWSRIDAVVAFKSKADSLALAGKLWEAMPIYRYAAFCVRSWKWYPTSTKAGATTNIATGCDTLEFDIEFSRILLLFRLTGLPYGSGESMYARYDHNDHRFLLRHGRRLNISQASKNKLEHFLQISRLLESAGSPHRKPLRDAITAMRALTPTAGLQHDIEHLQKLLRTRLPMNYKEELRGVLSFAKGPFQIMNESSQQDHFRDRPQRFVGWQDVEHLAQLTTEDKEKINALQVQKGLRITDWGIE